MPLRFSLAGIGGPSRSLGAVGRFDRVRIPKRLADRIEEWDVREGFYHPLAVGTTPTASALCAAFRQLQQLHGEYWGRGPRYARTNRSLAKLKADVLDALTAAGADCGAIVDEEARIAAAEAAHDRALPWVPYRSGLTGIDDHVDATWHRARTLYHPSGSPDSLADGEGGLILVYPHGVFWTVRGETSYFPASSVAAAKAAVAAARR